MPRLAKQLAGRRDRLGRMPISGRKWEEHRHDLVTHELVDAAVVQKDRLRGDLVEALQEVPVGRRG
jgi:hypothetical protein